MTCTHEPTQYIGHGVGGHQWNCACGRTMTGPEPERDDLESAAEHHERAATVFQMMIDKGVPAWVQLLREQSTSRAAAFREMLACERCGGDGRVEHLFGDQSWYESCDCAAGEARSKRLASYREDDVITEYEEGR